MIFLRLYILLVIFGCFSSSCNRSSDRDKAVIVLPFGDKNNKDSLFGENNNAQIDYYPNGSLKKVMVIGGDSNKNYEKEWYEDGKLKSFYYNLKIDTLSIFDEVSNEEYIIVVQSIEGFDYYKNGKKKSFKTFKLGKEYGTWIYWDSLGVKTKEEVYKDGIIVD